MSLIVLKVSSWMEVIYMNIFLLVVKVSIHKQTQKQMMICFWVWLRVLSLSTNKKIFMYITSVQLETFSTISDIVIYILNWFFFIVQLDAQLFLPLL